MNGEDDRVRIAAWHLEAGYPGRALEALREADAMDPGALYVRGRALLDMARQAEAEEAVRRGLDLDPEDVDLLELLAMVQMVRDPVAAEETLRSALALEPDSAQLLGTYVVLLLQQGRYEAAEGVLVRLMRVAPDAESTQRVRTMFMLNATHSAEALDAARELLRQYPDDAWAHYLQGLALLHVRWWEGFRHLRFAAGMRPQDPLMTETVRVMRSWYLWPKHLTGGVVGIAISLIASAVAIVGVVAGHPVYWYALLGIFGLRAYEWTVYLIARRALQRRVERAVRELHG